MSNYDELVKRLLTCSAGGTFFTSTECREAAVVITRLHSDKSAALVLIAALEKENAGLQAELKEAVEIISWFIENDETNEGDEPIESKNGATWNEINAYWIGGLNRGRDFVSKHEGKKG